ncbi:MAG: hypothetical protein R3D88_01335 [Alphaproteobacteria bacterium]|nr:hypothetical protein [Alphaproteobacteria bacterium]
MNAIVPAQTFRMGEHFGLEAGTGFLTVVPNGAPSLRKSGPARDRKDFNCYAHGLGLRHLGWVEPGRLAQHNRGNALKNDSVENIRDNLIYDGWGEVDLHACDPHKDHVIAVVYGSKNWLNQGYHVIRLNEGGQISQKRGQWGLSHSLMLNFSVYARQKIEGESNRLKVMRPEDFLTFSRDQFVGFFKMPETGMVFDPIYRPHPSRLRETTPRALAAQPV